MSEKLDRGEAQESAFAGGGECSWLRGELFGDFIPKSVWLVAIVGLMLLMVGTLFAVVDHASPSSSTRGTTLVTCQPKSSMIRRELLFVLIELVAVELFGITWHRGRGYQVQALRYPSPPRRQHPASQGPGAPREPAAARK